jgi:hypothetical protein
MDRNIISTSKQRARTVRHFIVKEDQEADLISRFDWKYLILCDSSPLIEKGVLLADTFFEEYTKHIIFEQSFLLETRYPIHVAVLNIADNTASEKCSAMEWLRSCDVIEYGLFDETDINILVKQLRQLPSLGYDSIYNLPVGSESFNKYSYWPGIAAPDGSKDGILTCTALVNVENLLDYNEVQPANIRDRQDSFLFWAPVAVVAPMRQS